MDHDHQTRWGRQVTEDLKGPYRDLRDAIPDVLAGYAELHRAAMGDGALPAKTKELIALAVAITRECDGCIAAHARGAFRRGASDAEVAEMIGVAVMMNGGPGTVWGPRALAAYREAAAPPADVAPVVPPPADGPAPG
ncbi:MAG TPA: carboxymuconolactone decarboxylase family protein [Acidimicrobiales bacterium]|nr:carboxymuconolactone decarboxylase family protein [Acidimicrobiales bacterium]